MAYYVQQEKFLIGQLLLHNITALSTPVYVCPFIILYCGMGTAAKKYTDFALKLLSLCCRIISGSPKLLVQNCFFTSLKILPVSKVYEYYVWKGKDPHSAPGSHWLEIGWWLLAQGCLWVLIGHWPRWIKTLDHWHALITAGLPNQQAVLWLPGTTNNPEGSWMIRVWWPRC